MYGSCLWLLSRTHSVTLTGLWDVCVSGHLCLYLWFCFIVVSTGSTLLGRAVCLSNNFPFLRIRHLCSDQSILYTGNFIFTSATAILLLGSVLCCLVGDWGDRQKQQTANNAYLSFYDIYWTKWRTVMMTSVVSIVLIAAISALDQHKEQVHACY